MSAIAQLLGFLPRGLYCGNPIEPASVTITSAPHVYQHGEDDAFIMARVGVNNPCRLHGYMELFSTDGAKTFYEIQPHLINRETSINGKPPVLVGGCYVDSEGESFQNNLYDATSPKRRIINLEYHGEGVFVGSAFVPIKNGAEIAFGRFEQLGINDARRMFLSASILYSLPKATTVLYEKNRLLRGLLSLPIMQGLWVCLEKKQDALQEFTEDGLREFVKQMDQAVALAIEIEDTAAITYSLHSQALALAMLNDPAFRTVFDRAKSFQEGMMKNILQGRIPRLTGWH